MVTEAGSGRATIDKPKAYILRFMRDNRERIESVTSLKITQPDDNPFGCGGYGCAYGTSDSKWIVKVTDDATEAALAKTVMNARKKGGGGTGEGPSTVLPGVVFFEGVWMRPDHAGKPMFVIVRENIRPFGAQDVVSQKYYKAHKWSKHEWGATAVALATQYANDFYEAGDSEAKATTAINEFIRWAGVVGGSMPLVSDTMLYFLDQGIVLRDVHDYNVGYTITDWGKKYRSPGSVVIFDLGWTQTVSKRGARYDKLNPVDQQKLEGAGMPEFSKREARIDSRRAPVAPTVHTPWLPPVKIPRLM
jgi:hypothetical protein